MDPQEQSAHVLSKREGEERGGKEGVESGERKEGRKRVRKQESRWDGTESKDRMTRGKSGHTMYD